MAPGMGPSTPWWAYSLVAGLGLSFASAMGHHVLEGFAITVLVLAGFREAIFRAITDGAQKAIVVGIGFFILFTGLVDGGIVGHRRRHVVTLGSFTTVPVACTLFGIRRHHRHARPQVARCHHPGHPPDHRSGSSSTTPTTRTPFGTSTAVIPMHVFDWPDFSLVGAFDFGAFAKLGVAATILWVFSF
jgi:AGZA family xanthine/uracil permease-like MFS transporter